MPSYEPAAFQDTQPIPAIPANALPPEASQANGGWDENVINGGIARQRRQAGLILGGSILAGAVTFGVEYVAANTEVGQAIGFGAVSLLALRAMHGIIRHSQASRESKQADRLVEALKHFDKYS